MNAKPFLLICAASMILVACSQPEQKSTPTAAPIVKKAEMMQPFKYHKLIEVAPGQDFDVLSWGRGGGDTSAFVILHSDSAARQYTTTTGDLDGPIVNVINTDMDIDGNPEIFVQSKSADTSHFTKVYAFEFNDNTAKKLDFPKLTTSQRKGYRGGDNFYIKDGKLMREFPLYDGTGKEAKQNGQKRELQYSFHGNTLSASQVSKDSTNTGNKEPEKKVIAQSVKTEEKKETKKSSSHHKESKHERHHSKHEKHSESHHKHHESKKKKHHHRR